MRVRDTHTPEGYTRAYNHAPPPPAGAPGCFARLNWIRIAKDGTAARPELNRVEFAQYLIGEGKGTDGSLPVMFTRNDDAPKAFAQQWLRDARTVGGISRGYDGKLFTVHQAWCAEIMRREMLGERIQHRLVLSPDPKYSRGMNASDMQEFTRRTMEGVEKDYSRELHWVAAAHFNTDHHHVHVGIRGLDAKHEPVFFHREYWQNSLISRGRTALWQLRQEGRVSRAG